MEDMIENLVKDISKYVGIRNEEQLHYIRLCLEQAYAKGSLDALNELTKKGVK